jgi:hypothetical protein
MSNCVTPYEAFHANLSAAGTTLMLCRANLRSLNISQAETAKTLWDSAPARGVGGRARSPGVA